jgi:hypothetical protein
VDLLSNPAMLKAPFAKGESCRKNPCALGHILDLSAINICWEDLINMAKLPQTCKSSLCMARGCTMPYSIYCLGWMGFLPITTLLKVH